MEELEKLQQRERELVRQLFGKDKTSTKRKRDSSASSEEGSKAVKIKNLIQFTNSMTYRRRREWLQDLQRAFEGDFKKFATDKNRILFALDQMEEQPRNRWYSRCNNLPADQREFCLKDWKAFESWTEECVNDLADQASSVAKQIQNARQREGQAPYDFHYYLESLESAFPVRDEKTRALNFYTKLLPQLIDHIDLYHQDKPENREEMVRIATRYWKTMQHKKRQRDSADTSTNSRGESHTGRPQHPQTPHWPRHDQKIDHHDDKRTEPEGDEHPTHGRERPHDDTQKNPNGNTCYICGSDEHYANRCPQREGNLNATRGYSRGRYQRARGNNRGNSYRQK
jgi:uncharacterized protein YukE